MEEIFRDIKTHKGLYQIGSKASIKSFHYSKEGRIIKSKSNGKYDYAHLHKDGKTTSIGVHVLVANAFLGEKDEDFWEVDHIDGNKHNNCVENLQWLSNRDNTRKSIAKKIGCYDLTGKLIKVYEAEADAKKDGFNASEISRCCNNKKPKYKGFLWKFID